VVAVVLDEREKTKLLREGVLVIEEYGRMGKRTVYSLTDEALEALRKLDSDNSK
jgi:DNA-binding PadR family transcriptional regulator